MIKFKDTSDLLKTTLQAALKQGCDTAEAVFVENDSISVHVRFGKLEKLERPTESALGLRVFFGQRQASLSTSDLSQDTLFKLVEQAATIAKMSPEDPFCGLAAKESFFSGSQEDLKLYDETIPTADDLKSLALEAEAIALQNKKIKKPDSSNASWQTTKYNHMTSNGFEGQKKTSRFTISTVVIAESRGDMERDYDYSMARYLCNLKPAANVGREAARRTVARLNPRKIKTQNVPVVFENRIAASLLRHFADAINGKQIAKGITFLANKMNKEVFSKAITVKDNPLQPGGLASRLFDAEGIPCKPIDMVDNGTLKSWLLDCPSAKELKLQTTGHAARTLANPPHPSPSNLYIENGMVPFEKLIASLKKGFLVTELIGMGVNNVTGDYSRGASGFWIENGQITHPVNEVTIASNLKDMFLFMTPAADLEFKTTVNAPSLLVDNMTVAGT